MRRCIAVIAWLAVAACSSSTAAAHPSPSPSPSVNRQPASAAGFLFAYPLRAGSVSNPNNKILWVVGVPRDGSDLHVTGHPQNATTPAIDQTFPANSSPGEIYPSIVNVPTAGCWHFDLSWGKNTTSVDLVYS